jgi:hypothetical protein
MIKLHGSMPLIPPTTAIVLRFELPAMRARYVHQYPVFVMG